jgi:hypothetical protein
VNQDAHAGGPADPTGPRGGQGETGARGAAALVTPLIEAVGALRVAIEGLEARADRARRNITGIVIAVIIDVIFTACITIVYIGQEQTAAQVADTRNEILCPLYASWLGTYNPTTRAPGLDRATYENVFGQMRGQYEHLACTTPLVPKPTPTTPPSAPPSK